MILEYKKDIVNENFNAGQLEEKVYLALKKQVDKHIVHLNNYTPSWVSPLLRFLYFKEHPTNQAVARGDTDVQRRARKHP